MDIFVSGVQLEEEAYTQEGTQSETDSGTAWSYFSTVFNQTHLTIIY